MPPAAKRQGPEVVRWEEEDFRIWEEAAGADPMLAVSYMLNLVLELAGLPPMLHSIQRAQIEQKEAGRADEVGKQKRVGRRHVAAHAIEPAHVCRHRRRTFL